MALNALRAERRNFLHVCFLVLESCDWFKGYWSYLLERNPSNLSQQEHLDKKIPNANFSVFNLQAVEDVRLRNSHLMLLISKNSFFGTHQASCLTVQISFNKTSLLFPSVRLVKIIIWILFHSCPIMIQDIFFCGNSWDLYEIIHLELNK